LPNNNERCYSNFSATFHEVNTCIANKLGTVDGGAANNQLPVVRPAAALMLMRRQGGQLLRGG